MVRFKAYLPDGTEQSMQVDVPVNYTLHDSCPEEFSVRYAQLDPHIFLLPGE